MLSEPQPNGEASETNPESAERAEPSRRIRNAKRLLRASREARPESNEPERIKWIAGPDGR
jgi:hypothetical protein